MQEVTPDIARLQVAIANVYFVGAPGGPWTLVDTGVPGFAAYIKSAAEQRYGPGARPDAIVLTHGHFDHAGSALALAREWDVPVYAHTLELPYVTGESLYPPYDPTVGGFLALMLRFIPQTYRDLRPFLRELPADGELPFLPGWIWQFTPGHAPGHISLYRPADGTLLAGDAFTTVNVDNAVAVLTLAPEICRPPAPATPDFESARDSIRRLADLEPQVVGCGHGAALTGPGLSARLHELAERFPYPEGSRYAHTPAVTDENGIVAVPPPAPDPLPRVVASVALVALIGVGVTLLFTRSRRNA